MFDAWWGAPDYWVRELAALATTMTELVVLAVDMESLICCCVCPGRFWTGGFRRLEGQSFAISTMMSARGSEGSGTMQQPAQRRAGGTVEL
jgi:hypothetical protein